MNLSRKWLIVLLVLPAVLQIAQPGVGLSMAEDEVENEEEGAVEDEEPETTEENVETDDGDESSAKKNVSPFAKTTLLFTRPAQNLASGSVELPAGHIVEFLVGFENNGESDFVVEALDASFRYPMDFSYHIQNFSAIAYHKTVKPAQEATVSYSFIPADAFAGRPIGLTINLAYRDLEGNFFFDPVFNETVQIVEFDEGFDTELFFMYVFIVAIAVLLLFLVFSFASKGTKGKKSASASKPVETGTSNADVDYEWIPKTINRTPGSGKTSPRQRKEKKKAAGSDTE